MKRPNVILISIDTLRSDHLSCYGYDRPTTPNIDRLAAEGAVFRQNYSTGVWTPPGHASMLTGLYVSEHGVYDTRRLADGIPTIAEVLKRHGYATAGFVNNSQVGELVGFDRGHDKFVEVWKGTAAASLAGRAVRGLIRRTKETLGLQDMGAARTNAEFREWIENGFDAAGPFYAFLHYIEPHNPLNPPRAFRKKYPGPAGVDRRKIKKAAHNPLICFIEDLALSRNEIDFLISLYDAEIEYTDSKIGEIVSILKERGLYEGTMIIITADHGEHFGEHGLWSHVASLYNEVLKVPLVIKYPKGVECAREVSGLTQLVDIFPTVMDVTGISENDRIRTSGLSLVSNRGHEYVFAEWEGRVPYFIQDRYTESLNPLISEFKKKKWMVHDGRYKYILGSEGAEELYDLVNDGRESNNRIGQNHKDSAALRERLRQWRASVDECAAGEDQREMDEITKNNLKSLGYL